MRGYKYYILYISVAADIIVIMDLKDILFMWILVAVNHAGKFLFAV